MIYTWKEIQTQIVIFQNKSQLMISDYLYFFILTPFQEITNRISLHPLNKN